MNSKDFQKVYHIMDMSFPQIEMRSKQAQKELWNIPEYAIETIEENGEICGFIAVWHLESCTFIEHIAIDPAMRGKQYGHTLIERLIDTTDKPIILEVEPPVDDITRRRIKFYEKSGFKLCYFDYLMPPLQPNFEALPMMIMSYPSEISAEEFEHSKSEIYRKIYDVDTI